MTARDKWRDPREYRVNDVEEAIELAEKFCQGNIYDWFRGQVKPWLPRTSIARTYLSGTEALERARARLVSLEAFMSKHPELQAISEDQDAFLAVAQHYGIPTPYLDFSTEPAIAGFFACDTPTPEPGSDSCIYCLNTDDVAKAWEAYKERQPTADIAFITHPVPNLWRLESQKGVFLYCNPGNWDVWYEMDKILFPYRGYPAYPPKHLIYPREKSALEILLDHFFVEEQRGERQRRILDHLQSVGIPIMTTDEPPDGYRPEFFKGGRLDPHPSWGPGVLKEWADAAAESFATMSRQPIPLSIDPSWSPVERQRRVTTAVAGALQIHPNLRQSLVAWDFGDQPITPHRDNLLLREAVEWLWDGMRRLPYSNAQITTAIGVCIQLASLGLSIETSRKRQLEIASDVFGPVIPIEFGGSDESYSRAFPAEQYLRSAMRDDLLEFVEDRHRHLFETTELILYAVFTPQRLFDYSRLCGLFAEQIIPFQVLARRGRVTFFSPSRLNALGCRWRPALPLEKQYDIVASPNNLFPSRRESFSSPAGSA